MHTILRHPPSAHLAPTSPAPTPLLPTLAPGMRLQIALPDVTGSIVQMQKAF